MPLDNLWVFLIVMIAVAGSARIAPVGAERWRIWASIAVVLAFLCWAPFVLSPAFRTLQLTSILAWAVAAMGLNILTGYNGQISLGHGALVALGAYVSAILIDGTEQMSFVDANPWPFWTTIIAAGVVTAVVGFFLAIPALRLSGPYLAIATLALAISFPSVMRKYDGFTGGSQGIQVRQPQPPAFLDVLDRDQWLFFLALFTAVAMLLIAWTLLHGPLGRAFVAVRDSEVAAEAMGINIARTKITAFTISAFFAGVSGGVYMQVFGFISPDAISPLLSITLFASVVIGGLASIMGSVIGAAALIFLPNEAPNLVGQLPGLNVEIVDRAPGAIQGAIVILVVLLLPTGAAGFLHRLQRLTVEEVVSGLRAIPVDVRGRAEEVAERFSSAWDIRPWARHLPSESKGPDDPPGTAPPGSSSTGSGPP